MIIKCLNFSKQMNPDYREATRAGDSCRPLSQRVSFSSFCSPWDSYLLAWAALRPLPLEPRLRTLQRETPLRPGQEEANSRRAVKNMQSCTGPHTRFPVVRDTTISYFEGTRRNRSLANSDGRGQIGFMFERDGKGRDATRRDETRRSINFAQKKLKRFP